MSNFKFARIAGAALCAAGLLAQLPVQAQAPASASAAAAMPNNDGTDGVLRVCADPENMPLSNKNGEGFENKIASQMAQDFHMKLDYTFFPQRMGFIRHTLREKIPNTDAYKCDLVIGVPKGYDMTINTRPYLHSTYAMVFANRPELASVHTPDDLLKLPPDVLHKLHFGIFTQTPAVDWLLQHNLIEQAVPYQVQSADPQSYPGEIIERGLLDGQLDVAFVWGPIAGYFAKRAGDKVVLVPFPRDPKIKFDYEISMGVRHGEKAWKDKIDQWVGANQQKIDQILVSYDVPLVGEDGAVLAKPAGKTP